MPRPRDIQSPGYLSARDRIFAAMGMNPTTGGEITGGLPAGDEARTRLP
jgi:NitT/TauT family transport system ATP-binding protein